MTAPRHAAPAIIDIEGLTKTFGRGRSAVHALQGLDLRVHPGEVAGFLGPKGAGKTTTIRILLGLIRADGGTARLFGSDPWSDRVALHSRLATVPGDVALWPRMSGGQVLDLLAGLRGERSDEPAARQRRADLIDRFDLDPSKKVRTYSTGNRQKVALVAALSANVDLLVLDEPTSGLDPLMEAVFRDCVHEARERGQAILLSSHILAEVEKLCDTVTILREGRTVEQGTLEDIRGILRTEVRASIHGDPHALRALPGIHDLVIIDEVDAPSAHAGSGEASASGVMVRFTVDPTHLDAALAELARAGVSGLVAAPPSLEDLFLRHYGHTPAPGSGDEQ